MALDYDELMALRRRGDVVEYSPRDAMLYALAVGMARDPLDRDELPFVYENPGLRVIPTLASTLAMPPLLDNCGWDFTRVLHGEERLTLHRPLIDGDRLTLDSRVAAVRDLGRGRGAIVDVELTARDAAGGAPVYSITRTAFARGDGGFGGPAVARAPKPAMPARSPDLTCRLETRPDQALLFRLCGDFNPLHADPALAQRVGLERPLLHGLCTFGIACRAILKTICEYDATLIRALDVRFSSPLYPGETVVTEMWQQANVVSFRARSVERDRLVLNHGRCVLAT